MRFRRRPPSPKIPSPETVEDLRDVERRLSGWTLNGTTGVDLQLLLRQAARELEEAVQVGGVLAIKLDRVCRYGERGDWDGLREYVELNLLAGKTDEPTTPFTPVPS